MFDGRVRAPRSAAATSRPDGSFVLGPVDPDAELTPRPPRSGHSSTARADPGEGLGGGADPADGRRARHRRARPAGSSTTTGGRSPAPRSGSGRPLGVGRAGRCSSVRRRRSSFETDAEGRFEGPRRLRRDREYRALAEADGALARPDPAAPPRAARASWTSPRSSCRASPDGSRSRARVLDRKGPPGGRASGSATLGEGPCCRRARTDADGRFRLDDLAEGSRLPVRRGRGIRFSGRAIDPARGPFDLTLTRLDEAPDGSMRTLTPAPPALATGPGGAGPVRRAGPEPGRPRDPGPDARAARPGRPEAGPGPDRRPGGRGRLVRRPPPPGRGRAG